MTNPQNAPISKVERILAFMAVGLAVVSFISLLIVLAAPLFGVAGDALTGPGWQILFLIAYFGFPIAFLLIVGVVVWRIVANRRARRDNSL